MIYLVKTKYAYNTEDCSRRLKFKQHDAEPTLLTNFRCHEQINTLINTDFVFLHLEP